MNDESRAYCDLVMKGGVTSGVIYPPAVLELVERYDLRSIGGTSAGAIAAAASAAAALGKRRKALCPEMLEFPADEVGFEGLEKAAAQLQTPRFIYRLFQPGPGGGAAFRLFVRLSAMPGPRASLWAAFLFVLETGWWTMLAGFALTVALGWVLAGGQGAVGAAIPALLSALLIGAGWALWRVTRALKNNRFGLCPGLRQPGREAAVTDWLHRQLQTLSGQTRPLLFGDLWNAPLYEDEAGQKEARPDDGLFEKVVALQLMTTGLSHREPRTLPFENSCFWFDLADFERLFPEDVVGWLIDRPGARQTIGGKVRYRLPQGDQMPVIVATRMSLSFPILLSAIRLYEEKPGSGAQPLESGASQAGAPVAQRKDRFLNLTQATEALTTGGTPCTDRPATLRECWFTDGGISSNLPLHLFDAPLPRWPTFAINLVPRAAAAGAPKPEVTLPQDKKTPFEPPFPSYVGIGPSSALGEVASFLLGIVDTMQNWRDLLLSRAPGHRDRIVHVPLDSTEGGLNLDMPDTVIKTVVAKGRLAGQKLRDEFVFDNHRWIRWRNVAATAEQFIIAFGKTAGSRSDDADPLPPVAGDANCYPLKGTQPAVAQARFATMVRLGRDWRPEADSLAPGAPEPQGQLRIVPTF